LFYCSTVGNEASGTGNMKFAMNGCLLLAARGGSNDEIQQEIGDENIVKFLSTPINIKFVAYDVIIGS
jgi:starch phosphorylase